MWQLILNAGSPLEGNQITLGYFVRACLSLLCAVPHVSWSLFTHIPSLTTLLCSLNPLLIPLGQGEPARSAAAPVLRPSLSICWLSFCALPKGFPASSALETSWGECRLPALPAHLLFFFFPPSLYLFIFFLSFSRPHGVTLTDFWWVAGSTRQCTWWWWFYCASDLQSIAEVPVMPTAVI